MASTRRSTLALARPQRPRLALRLRAMPLVALGLVLAAGLVYLGARETSVFALRQVVVSGAPDDVARSVREALRTLTGESLASLSAADVERRVRALPGVLSASVDRDFPGTLRVAVRPERPVAVLRLGDEAWLVSARARIIGKVERRDVARLPRIWLPRSGNAPVPGTIVLEDEGGALVRALARLPEALPSRVVAAHGTVDSLVLVLASGCELRLGQAVELRLKLEVAAAVLASLSAAERQTLGYVDVSVPERPVAGANPTVAGRA